LIALRFENYDFDPMILTAYILGMNERSCKVERIAPSERTVKTGGQPFKTR